MRDQPLVLIVDDDAFVRRILRSRLEAQRYVVDETAEGSQAVELVRSLRPDAVLLDVILPDTSGLEVCARIRREPDLADIPVLFVTATEDLGTKAAGFALGGYDYITKSVDPRELVMRVKAAIMAKRHRDQLSRQALQDPLTGLWNRRFLEERSGQLLNEAAATGLPAAVFMVDVDHFKRVNDRLGHAAGDSVLRQVAGQLRGALRDQDLCIRYGGEEFCALLPGAGLESGARAAERVRAQIEAMHVSLGDVTIRVTVSVGVAAYPVDGTCLGELQRAADRRLYMAKQGGRNRVIANV
ncbi:MAG TPA: diguanylate cyclase [Symbiobacteriaceae bacterium]|nr:diguanylate cyclase [Symbiobacteriaceae bacterium]